MKNRFMVFPIVSLSAQPIDSRNSPSALFDHFKEMDDVVSISIPSFLIKLGLGIAGKNMQINIGGAGSLIPPGLCKSAKTIRIATTEDAEAAKKMREMFGEFIDKSGFSEFVCSNEKSEKAVIYIHIDENSARLLISAEERREFSVVYLQAKIDTASFMEIMQQET